MTRYDFFRKRIAPILFLGIVALIAYDAWKKGQSDGIAGTVVIDLGAAAPRVREVEADLMVEGEPVGWFRRAAQPDAAIGACRFGVRMPKPAGELRIAVDVGGARKQIVRAVHVEDGATVTVAIGADL